eukprot:Tbor_TRINITY_DN4157_c0_g1::TRINITY_DN4157_c0_g1_i1::g.26577::m.26577
MSNSVRVSGIGPLVDYDAIRSFFSNCGTVVEVIFLSELSIPEEKEGIVNEYIANVDDSSELSKESESPSTVEDINKDNADKNKNGANILREAIVTFLDRCGALTAVMVTGSKLGGSQITVTEAKGLVDKEKEVVHGNNGVKEQALNGVAVINSKVTVGAAVVANAMVKGLETIGGMSTSVASAAVSVVNPTVRDGPPTHEQHGEGNQPQWGPPPCLKNKK